MKIANKMCKHEQSIPAYMQTTKKKTSDSLMFMCVSLCVQDRVQTSSMGLFLGMLQARIMLSPVFNTEINSMSDDGGGGKNYKNKKTMTDPNLSEQN